MSQPPGTTALNGDGHALDHGPLSRTPEQERQFQAAVRLRDWVNEFLDGPARTEWAMSPGALNNVFVGTFARGTKTFRAALLLCDRGYGQQAAMLARSLFEHAVVAWWLLLCVEDEEDVMERLRQHRDHAQVLYDRALGAHPELAENHEDADFDADYIARLDKRFGRYGGQWHGKRLDELVREVEAEVDERYETVFWKFFRLVNTHNNRFLHHSSVGIADAMRWDDPETSPKVEVGPSPPWRTESLFAVTWSYGLLVVATLRRLSPAYADDFCDFLDEVTRAFITFRPDQVKNVGRNDPCPCGSGEKFKRCHGPLVAGR